MNFYPGPSKVYPQVMHYAQEAFASGILSLNHRSSTFMHLYESTTNALRQHLQIPANYWIAFVSSATECWEIVPQSWVQKKSLHIYNGSFGEKWAQNAQKILAYKGKEIEKNVFEANEILTYQKLADSIQVSKPDTICFIDNETSNGTMLSNEMMPALQKNFPEILFCTDATSSLAGRNLPIAHFDVVFASVQKCFGLPSGLGVLIYSPKALERAIEIDDKQHYNNVLSLHENAQKQQTTHTPNILGIYLLEKILQELPSIEKQSTLLQQRAKEYYTFFSHLGYTKPLIHTPEVRSDTVIVIEQSPNIVQKCKQEASKKGIILGNGYGKWKENTLRIANFPAIDQEEIQQLKDFFLFFSIFAEK
ncbi:MAG: aminotransferase class V-fold PLP-dependent enzyme [Cytophagales bacterium]|nr:MAG: aminotransferase class V-fold PLP-dependent enzyme [Cytophagales bacterium]